MAAVPETVGGDCSVLGTVAAVGDAWSWLVLREAIFDGVDRFEGFQARLGVARSTLTARLEHLAAGGILARQPPRYVPSGRGADFFGCLMTAMAWGDRWYAGRSGPPLGVTHLGCGRRMTADLRCSHCHQPLLARDVRYERRPPPESRRVIVKPRRAAASWSTSLETDWFEPRTRVGSVQPQKRSRGGRRPAATASRRTSSRAMWACEGRSSSSAKVRSGTGIVTRRTASSDRSRSNGGVSSPGDRT